MVTILDDFVGFVHFAAFAFFQLLFSMKFLRKLLNTVDISIIFKNFCKKKTEPLNKLIEFNVSINKINILVCISLWKQILYRVIINVCSPSRPWICAALFRFCTVSSGILVWVSSWPTETVKSLLMSNHLITAFFSFESK
jgi:hypothetical protein